jgi:uracil-DNA glycosylase family 4
MTGNASAGRAAAGAGRDAAAPRRGAADGPVGRAGADLAALASEVADCRRCPRLVAWREQVGAAKVARHADQDYWARGVPGFGDPAAWLLIVGLAPGAHGSNRTGRMFTGDRSGEWLYAALHRAGLASQPTALARGDGLTLHGTYITACVRCAPPGNQPAPGEWANCRPFLERELDLLAGVRVIVCLGQFAWTRLLVVLRERGLPTPRPAPAYAHGAEVAVAQYYVLASFHPSQQNTFTGRLTQPMFDAVWARAVELGAGALR